MSSNTGTEKTTPYTRFFGRIAPVGDPVIQRSVHLRNPYVDPLNYLQVEMLRRLRALPDQEGPEAERLREVIVVTINGIAAGLRNTG